MSLFTKKVEPERERKDIHILMRCGIGDTLAYLARLNSLLRVYPGSRVYFHVGGFQQEYSLNSLNLSMAIGQMHAVCKDISLKL